MNGEDSPGNNNFSHTPLILHEYTAASRHVHFSPPFSVGFHGAENPTGHISGHISDISSPVRSAKTVSRFTVTGGPRSDRPIEPRLTGLGRPTRPYSAAWVASLRPDRAARKEIVTIRPERLPSRPAQWKGIPIRMNDRQVSDGASCRLCRLGTVWLNI